MYDPERKPTWALLSFVVLASCAELAPAPHDSGVDVPGPLPWEEYLRRCPVDSDDDRCRCLRVNDADQQVLGCGETQFCWERYESSALREFRCYDGSMRVRCEALAPYFCMERMQADCRCARALSPSGYLRPRR